MLSSKPFDTIANQLSSLPSTRVTPARHADWKHGSHQRGQSSSIKMGTWTNRRYSTRDDKDGHVPAIRVHHNDTEYDRPIVKLTFLPIQDNYNNSQNLIS